MAHLTLARVKNLHNKSALLHTLKGIHVRPIKFRVTDFMLKRSELDPAGSVYTDVKKFGSQ